MFFWELSVAKKWMGPVVQGGPMQFLLFEYSPFCFEQVGRMFVGDGIRLGCVDWERMCNCEPWLWIVAGGPTMFSVECGGNAMNVVRLSFGRAC